MKWKRPLAMAGVIFILAMYVIAIVSAFSKSPSANNWLMAAIFLSLIHIYQLAEAALRAHSENQNGLRNTMFSQYDSLLRGGRRVSAYVRVDGTRHRY